MRLIAVRHGETEWNLQGREIGQLDSPLTERGIQQAQLIAQRLNRSGFDFLYSSDLGRAVHTAEIIAGPGLVQTDSGLRERNMGIFQGLTIAEMRLKYPNERADFERIGSEYVIPEGESGLERLARSVRVLTGIGERHRDQTVVVVTHGGFLMGFFEYVLGLHPGNGWRFKRQNGSYSAFEYADTKWSLVTWNDTSHLEELRSLDDPTAQGTEGQTSAERPG